ncbi:MAG: CYTH domain-containing protein [Acidobacteria bacterium]|nr:MAG: CYTH domain-containing protein [Acidobacteriota bacterium]
MSDEHESAERELKFAGVEHSLLRERLIDWEAECQGSGTLEDNWVFDRDGTVAAAGQVLRLRVDRRGTHLTFKGPATFDGTVKVRVEHETGVEDPKKMRAILEALGFETVRRYQKIREEWRLGSIKVALDHTPIGDFVELEGEGCERLARRFGLDPARAERRSYLRLYEEYKKDHPEAPADMIFPPAE